MTSPTQKMLFQTLDETWPAAAFLDVPPWTCRAGAGGGQRVSAVTALGDVTPSDIASAETAMREMDQHPLFMLRPGDEALDGWLDARGYSVVDPVAIYLRALGGQPAALASLDETWPPTPKTCTIWLAGGIGPSRIAVMERVATPKTALVAKRDGAVTGVTFVAIHGTTAMLHALEVSPAHRRLGIGRTLMDGAANWARAQGADWLSLMVTRANAPANALYRSLGMSEVGRYHYRRAP